MTIQADKNPATLYPAFIGEFNLLRFVAAIWVVFFHLRTFNIALFGDAVAARGYLAVDMFFILSGFIISHVYLDKIKAGTFDYRSFLILRLARIYPLHIAIIIMFFMAIFLAKIAGIPLNQPFPLNDIPAQLFLLHGWGYLNHLSWNGPSWSISAEWFAYLIFPFIAFLILRFQTIPIAMIGLAVINLIVINYLSYFLTMDQLTSRTWNFSILRIFPEFLLGCAIYQYGNHNSYPKMLIVPTLAISLMAIFYLSVENILPVGIVLMLALFIFAIGELAKQFPKNPLKNNVFIWLGEISYSIYMIHSLVLLVIFKILTVSGVTASHWPLPVTIASVILVIAASALTYQLVEVPGRRCIVNASLRLRAG